MIINTQFHKKNRSRVFYVLRIVYSRGVVDPLQQRPPVHQMKAFTGRDYYYCRSVSSRTEIQRSVRGRLIILYRGGCHGLYPGYRIAKRPGGTGAGRGRWQTHTKGVGSEPGRSLCYKLLF